MWLFRRLFDHGSSYRDDFPSAVQRFGICLQETIGNPNLPDNLDDCFQLDEIKVFSSACTHLPCTQELLDNELKRFSKVLKPHQHLFIYMNVPRDLSLLRLFHKHVNIWLLLDFQGSDVFWPNTNQHSQNIVAIVDTGHLEHAFTMVRRETLVQIMTRLDTAQLFSTKPAGTYFGFG